MIPSDLISCSVRDAWRVREAHFPLQVRFVRPHKTAAISVTGASCALRCAHCDGRYLRGMMPLSSADVRDARSCLISGGCDLQGRVPLLPHLPQIAALRAGRRLNWHVGLADEETIRAIAPYADVVSFDIVGDDATIHEVYGLSATAADYWRTYDLLRRYVPMVVPHITIGLRGGHISGEHAALAELQRRGVEIVVYLVLIPTRGTAYAECAPPSPETVGDVLAAARCALPETALYLGCMRPGGSYRDRVDAVALRAGVNAIVNPAPSAVALAAELGLRVVWDDECCVFENVK